MKRFDMRRSLHFNFFDIIVYLVTTAFAIVCFYPLWYVFLVSIMKYETYIKSSFILFPPLDPTFEYYKYILSSKYFGNAFLVSVAKTFLGTAGTIFLTSAMAYAVSKDFLKGMKFLNFLMIFTMFFSGGLIPTFMLYRNLKLLGTFWVMFIPSFTVPSIFVIMRNYFSYSVPKELEDSSKIDGASDFVVFFRIIMPLSKSMIAAMTLFVSVTHWNDFMTFLLYVDKMDLQPFIWLLRRMLLDPNLVATSAAAAQGGGTSLEFVGPPLSLKMTTIICTVLPIMAVYPLLQKHFAKGILIGAVKG